MSQDDETVSRAKSGDAAAWRELYLAHAGRLSLWLRTLSTGDAACSADDIAAEAWLVAARKVHDFRDTSEQFAGWLFGIARLEGQNVRRRSIRRATDPDAEAGTSGSADTVDVAGDVVGADRVRRLLATLPTREAEVLACLEVIGLDVASTARALGVSSGNVRVARHRGLRRLRGRLEGHDDTLPDEAQSLA